MSNNNLNWIANFIWGIADDVLRDVYVRGKYRDVILPMVVIRRLDAVIEATKKAVPISDLISGFPPYGSADKFKRSIFRLPFGTCRRGCSGDNSGIQGAGYISTDPEKYFKVGHSNSNAAPVFLGKSKDSIRQSL